MARASIQAEIDLNTSKFQRGLAKSQRGISKFVREGIGRFAALGAAFFGVRLAKDITSLGLAAEETASKFRSVFGPAADDMNAKVEELRKTIPATTAEMQDALATFAAMAKGFGLNATAANLFSVEMVKISGDLASFHNMRSEEAFLKIRAAISGEFEPLKALGIVLSADLIKQEAFNIGIYDGIEALNQSQKAIAVQSLVLKNMGVAQGDAAATANSAANQVKFASAALKEFGTTIGVLLVPVIEDFTGGLKIMGGWLDKIKGKAADNDVFVEMAESALIASDQFEKFGILDQKIFGFQSRSSKEKQARNMVKLKERADDLRESFKKLSIEEQEEIKNGLLSSEEQQGIKKRADAQAEFLKQLEAIQKAQGDFEGSGGTMKVKADGAKALDIEQTEKLKKLEVELNDARASGNMQQIEFIKEKINLQDELVSKYDKIQVSLKQQLDDIDVNAEEKRRVGDFSGSKELLNKRFGIRREITAARSKGRIAAFNNNTQASAGGGVGGVENEGNSHLIQIQASLKVIERELTL